MYIATNKTNRPAMALIVVLLVVMIASLVSLSFISRSDVELACGDNMISRAQTDCVAESGLEHAKGLILSPQDVTGEYWTGAVAQQLVAGSDVYYDVTVRKTGNCNYQITSDSYRLDGAAKISQGSLGAEVRIDPAIAFWAGTDTAIGDGITVNGDAYCAGAFSGDGRIYGDAFAKSSISISSSYIQGASNTYVADADRPIEFPTIDVTDFEDNYYIGTTQYKTKMEGAEDKSGKTYSSSDDNPAGIVYFSDDFEMEDNVVVNGSLIVNGNLRISGSGNVITAFKNFPAIVVSGNLIIERGGKLQVTGAVIVKGRVLLSESATSTTITGALCIGQDIVPMTADSSGNKNHAVLLNSPSWVSGKVGSGALDFNGSNQYLVVSNNSTVQITTKLSVAAWIKADSWGSSHDVDVIVRKGQYSPASYQFCIKDRRVTLMLNESDYDGVQGNTYLNTGQWYHVAATWDDDWVRIYVNGVPDRFPALRNYTLPTDTSDLYLGGRDGGDYFDGIIDDIQLYDNKKSDGDISDIMNGNSKSDLVGRWRFDENGNSKMDITISPDKAAMQTWPWAGTAQRWTPAGGAFFKNITRR